MSKKRRFTHRNPQVEVHEEDTNQIKLKKDVTIVPRNLNQETYLKYLNDDNCYVTIAIGPAGTGKTIFPCHHAVKLFKKRLIDKIIVTRPAVSVDEKHGFLPGTLEKKMEPWTKPLFDVFEEYWSKYQLEKMLEAGVIEICPLAFMRGRTFKNSFIIFDEAQNSTPNQMKMVLTRIGEGSRMVVTGDVNQHDRGYDENGLKDFIIRLSNNTPSIKVVNFSTGDVQRHPVVEQVLRIYGED